ncbi:ester cyclase [Streptomyces prunicolor]|uniref:nuclear transport factor 2 family protein n=1 Tax=Streptomyces prunicolor TaxID=67348 RepID=UPI0037D181CB
MENYVDSLTQDRNLKAVDRYVSRSLVQHQPDLANGGAAVKKSFADLFTAHPQFQATVAQIVAEGDLVAVHSHYQNTPDDLGESVYDIYRVEHGKIVEHWSAVQAGPATSANDNTML